jgi:hypothetical protein
LPITAQIDGIGNLEFPDDTSPDVIHQTVQKVVMQHNAPKPLSGASTPVPSGLQGPAEPEYKPFLSSGNLRDEATGLLKVGAQDVALAGKGLSHIPIIGTPIIDPQKVKDMENYSTSANKGELFGKVLGNIAQALPAIYGGGEFAGGVADVVGPALLAPAINSARGVLGRVAVPAAKHLLKGAGAGAGLYGLEKLRELF